MIVGSLFSKRPRVTGSNCRTSCFAGGAGFSANAFSSFQEVDFSCGLLIKCSGGQDRTSFAAALYLIHREGWAAREKALAQFARLPYLHFPKQHQRWLQPFIAFAAAEAAGRPIAEWTRDSYDPARLKSWLEERGHHGTFKGIFERPVGSRWQW